MSTGELSNEEEAYHLLLDAFLGKGHFQKFIIVTFDAGSNWSSALKKIDESRVEECESDDFYKYRYGADDSDSRRIPILPTKYWSGKVIVSEKCILDIAKMEAILSNNFFLAKGGVVVRNALLVTGPILGSSTPELKRRTLSVTNNEMRRVISKLEYRLSSKGRFTKSAVGH